MPKWNDCRLLFVSSCTEIEEASTKFTKTYNSMGFCCEAGSFRLTCGQLMRTNAGFRSVHTIIGCFWIRPKLALVKFVSVDRLVGFQDRSRHNEGAPLNAFVMLIKGFLIGIANIIPGVSGGTFALILGIFDRLVNALKSFDLGLVKTLTVSARHPFAADSRRKLGTEWKRTDAAFLLLIGGGAVLSLATCAWVFDYLLKEQPGMTLAFFIGLIVPSIAVPYRMMSRRGALQLFWILPGAALTVWLAQCDVSGTTGEPGFAVIFLGGMLAISAMILPGVSGSFCLLILGLYQATLSHIKAMTHAPKMESLVFLGTLGLGCVVGLVLFSRIMSFLLKRFRSATLAFLIGLIIGSFWVLWPIKDYGSGAVVRDSSGAEKKDIVIATAPNRLPGDQEGDLVLCGKAGLALLIGLAGAAGVGRLGKVKES